MLAHGAVLRKNFFSADQLLALVKDFRNAGLPAEEVALMTFAQKVITHPGQIDEQDMDALRQLAWRMKRFSMWFWSAPRAVSLVRRSTRSAPNRIKPIWNLDPNWLKH